MKLEKQVGQSGQEVGRYCTRGEYEECITGDEARKQGDQPGMYKYKISCIHVKEPLSEAYLVWCRAAVDLRFD